jgi:hypothetical protein
LVEAWITEMAALIEPESADGYRMPSAPVLLAA